MTKVYYIEGLDKYLKGQDANLPMKLGENLVELDTQEKKEALINVIKRTDHIDDVNFQQYVKNDFPLFLKYIKKTPIELEKLKEDIQFVFKEIPDTYFEEDNTLIAMRKILNFIISKNEISFIITNILNGKLEYNEKQFRHKKSYGFYFHMIKLNNHLDIYYSYVRNSQILMERIFLRDLFFSERKEVSKKELVIFRETHNFIGKNLVEFRFFLKKLGEIVQSEKMHIKRANIPVPKNYWDEEAKLTETINRLTKEVELEIQQTTHRKEEIIKYISEKRVLTKENLKILLDILGIGDWFF